MHISQCSEGCKRLILNQACTCSSGAGGKKPLGKLGIPDSPKSKAPMLCRKLPTVCCWFRGGVEVPSRSAFLFSAVCIAFHTSSTVLPLYRPTKTLMLALAFYMSPYGRECRHQKVAGNHAEQNEEYNLDRIIMHLPVSRAHSARLELWI